MEKEETIIGINASFARKPNTGIGQVTLNFLKKLSEYEVGNSQYKAKYKFILYLEEDLPAYFKLPGNFEKRIFLPLWKRDDLIRKIWWEKYLLPKRVNKDNCDVFISPYQCPTVIARDRSDRGNLLFSKNVQNSSRLLRYARNDIMHIMVVHDIVPELFPEYLNNIRKNIYWKLTKSGIRKADKIIAVSKRTEKDLIEKLGIDAQKISVAYIDVDEIYKNKVSNEASARVLRKYKLKPGYILAGGGYEVRKNVAGTIQAYKLILERNKKEQFIPNFPKLAIYGKLLPQLAPLATDAEKLTKELNLTQHVKLLNMVPQKDMPAIFQNASMFVYPSFYEGFGMPVLEAMNSGTPVVAGKTSSIPEVGGDGVLYCDPGSIDDIAMVMKNLMGKHELRETLKQRGLQRAKMFNWGKFTEKILNIAAEN